MSKLELGYTPLPNQPNKFSVIWKSRTRKIMQEGDYRENVARKIAYHQTQKYLNNKKIESIDLKYEYNYQTQRYIVITQIAGYKPK